MVRSLASLIACLAPAAVDTHPAAVAAPAQVRCLVPGLILQVGLACTADGHLQLQTRFLGAQQPGSGGRPWGKFSPSPPPAPSPPAAPAARDCAHGQRLRHWPPTWPGADLLEPAGQTGGGACLESSAVLQPPLSSIRGRIFPKAASLPGPGPQAPHAGGSRGAAPQEKFSLHSYKSVRINRFPPHTWLKLDASSGWQPAAACSRVQARTAVIAVLASASKRWCACLCASGSCA